MGDHKKILVVEDDRVMREMIGMVLSKAGYELTFAEDGAAAVSRATEDRPDLVLSDGLLPKLHGFLACKAIKSLENPPKVILLTGVYRKPTYKWEVMDKYGADEVLLKPVQPAELVSCIDKHLKAA